MFSSVKRDILIFASWSWQRSGISLEVQSLSSSTGPLKVGVRITRNIFTWSGSYWSSLKSGRFSQSIDWPGEKGPWQILMSSSRFSISSERSLRFFFCHSCEIIEQGFQCLTMGQSSSAPKAAAAPPFVSSYVYAAARLLTSLIRAIECSTRLYQASGSG